jgi:hypothetical protein
MFAVRSVVAAALLGVGAWAVTARAEDAAAPSSDEAARIRHLIDDLGSDDFRVREGAQKALSGFGERALPALREARSHANPEVRFRAEQLVRQVEGGPRERVLRTEEDGRGRGRAGGSLGLGSEELEREFERLLRDNQAWVERLERQMREMQEWLRSGRGGFGPGFGPRLDVPFAGREERDRVFERGDARLVVKPDGVRLTVEVEGEDGTERQLVLEAESVEALREKVRAHETLRDDPSVASVLRQSRRLGLRMPTFRFGTPGQPGGPGTLVRGLTVEHRPDGVKVTVTEAGPDGKPVSKTYEGKDLDQVRREHPEIAEHLGGLRFEFDASPSFPFGHLPGFGPQPERPRPTTRGEDDDDREDEDDSDDGEDDDEPVEPRTGPFGIAIDDPDESLRLHLGLREDSATRVLHVRPGSPAAKIGLQAHDLILSVDGPNGKVSGGPEAVVRGLRGAEQDVPVTIEVLRAGKPLRLSR